MLKKLFFIFCLLFIATAFSQEISIDKVTTAPNPFSTKTNIYFSLSSNKNITFTVKNILGKIVFHKLIKGEIGNNSISFFKNNLSSGVYIYTLKDSKQSISKRFVIQ